MTNAFLRWVLGLMLLAGPRLARVGDDPPYEPTARYEVRPIEGWTVRVNKGLLQDQPELAERTLELLRFQLYQIVRRLPEPAVARLRQVPIWVEAKEGHHPCMAYHPAGDWLTEHGMNPEKARCVEVADARNFLRWTIEQPWMVLHELAHAYHHRFLEKGFENAAVRAAFDQAMKGGRYDTVLRINGRDDRAYATTNPMEYFAEATEAYFGTNDFYPYVRSELKRHDPPGWAMMEQVWKGQ